MTWTEGTPRPPLDMARASFLPDPYNPRPLAHTPPHPILPNPGPCAPYRPPARTIADRGSLIGAP
jgi:hypothetical protein